MHLHILLIFAVTLFIFTLLNHFLEQNEFDAVYVVFGGFNGILTGATNHKILLKRSYPGVNYTFFQRWLIDSKRKPQMFAYKVTQAD